MEQNLVKVRINGYNGDDRKVVKLFGKKYRLSKSAELKYTILGEALGALSILVFAVMIYFIGYIFM